jgi:uncharacterized linocin/CFP29 family protein
MNLLKRDIAPITSRAWKAIDQEAARTLKVCLAARKLVDVDGPYGWELGAVNTGKLELIEKGPVPEVGAGVREMQPLLELRTPFSLPLMDLDSIERGSEAADLDPVVEAAERIAAAEDRTVFQGFAHARITGILEACGDPIAFGGSPEDRYAAIVTAWQGLQHDGINGPYGLAVGDEMHTAILEATDDGYPIERRIRNLIEGPIVRSDVLKGGVLLSMRGGDFKLTIGQDLSIGYVGADREKAELYVTGSHTFQVLEPAAAVAFVLS